LDLVLASVTVLLIVLGSLLSLRGYEILMGFVRLLSGCSLAGVGVFIGFKLGEYFGGDWNMIYALSLGALGFLTGFLFGPKLLQLALSISIFILCGAVGYLVTDEVGGEPMVAMLSGVVIGLISAWILSSIAKKLILAATIALGSAMMGTGIFILIKGDIPLDKAGLLSFGVFMVMALTGFLVQRSDFSGHSRR
jgi:hypothetical protein